MPIETHRRYWSDEDVELRRVVTVLFNGIVSSAVRADEEEWTTLKEEIEKIDSSIENEFTTEHLLVSAGAAVQALNSYNQRTTRFTRKQGIEFQKIIIMLTQAVLTITGSSERSCGSNFTQVLGKIRGNLEHAEGLEDLHDVREQLGACLKQVCEEHLAGKYSIEIVDLLVNPQLARGDQIVAIPTLVRKLPAPIRRIIGDLSNTERVLVGLQLRPNKPPKEAR